MKRSVSVILILFALSVAFMIPTNANSAQTHWRGVDSTGAVVIDDSCPVEVAKEVLTFDISEFPENYYRDAEEYLAYTGRVTAEYTFYNPTDITVTATLAFPFGTQPDYANVYDEESQTYVTNVDTEKYDITVNGEAIDKKIRYTLNTDSQFDLENDLPKLHDGYVNDAFYSPNMTVTMYTYIVGGIDKEVRIDKEKYPASAIAFDWDGGDGKTKIYFPEQSGFHLAANGDARFSRWADNGSTFNIYAIGQPFTEPLEWKCYEDGGVEDKEEIGGTVSLIDTETMTLEELALADWNEDTGVTKVDWYNAVIDSFDENLGDNVKYNYVNTTFRYNFSRNLMRWYQYEITIAPYESIINTVTAPIYPEIDERYAPPVFSYTYLLSPASTWASFGELEIIVNTPFYIIENSIGEVVKTDFGYTMKFDRLPDEELEFSLCSEGNTTKVRGRYAFAVIWGLIGVIIASLYSIGVAVSFIVGAVILIVFLFKRKYKKNKQ